MMCKEIYERLTINFTYSGNGKYKCQCTEEKKSA